jgi:hypothetical protein
MNAGGHFSEDDAGKGQSATSRFGSSLQSPTAAAALLRARAAAAGAAVVPATAVDKVAAVLGAEGWMCAYGTESLAVPVRHGSVAVNALAAILTRAAGLAEVHGVPLLAAASTDSAVLRRLETMADWAERMIGADAPEALRRAAGDLAVACEDNRVEAVAGTLVIIADTLEAGRMGYDNR